LPLLFLLTGVLTGILLFESAFANVKVWSGFLTDMSALFRECVTEAAQICIVLSVLMTLGGCMPDTSLNLLSGAAGFPATETVASP